MENENSYKDYIIKRAKNFFIDDFPFFYVDISLEHFFNIKSIIENTRNDMDYKESILETLHKIYLFNRQFDIFYDQGSDYLYQKVQDSFLFTTLCFFSK